MTLNQLVLRSMKKNIKHYYLYFFALIFSVTLYFSFVTLQMNGEVSGEVEDSVSATAGFEVATYLLYFIVLVFVLYANHLFMKRRSNELGLYQLIGMTKGLIFRLLALENVILFGGAVVIGLACGFLSSRFFALILLNLLGSESVVGLTFSFAAMLKTIIVFILMLVIILGQLFFVIKRQTLLQLFTASRQSDEGIGKFSLLHMLMGLVGVALIVYGYMKSTVLFDSVAEDLVKNMMIVLGTTIAGTFLIFRFSVAFFINLLRMKKNGHLSKYDVIALTPIMHRMKANAKSLTLIAILTAVSLAINTLGYIGYYSSEKDARNDVPSDFVLLNEKGADFLAMLDTEAISYVMKTYHIIPTGTDFEALLKNPDDVNSATYYVNTSLQLIAASEYGTVLRGNDAILAGYHGYTAKLVEIVLGREVTLYLMGGDERMVKVIETDESAFLYTYGNSATTPALIVSDKIYDEINSRDPSEREETHVSIQSEKDLERAQQLYEQSEANVIQKFDDNYVITSPSLQELRTSNMQTLGLTIFITAFLGLAFLLATCSILYFKQMSEAESERGSYEILRKIGYSTEDLMKGIYVKQAFNFGIPLIVGLLHSYFAVKSGWWLFGSELVMPLVLMMALYILMYVIFGVLSTNYYKKVIKASF